MALYLVNLDARTRQLMREEMEYDAGRNELHISPVLSGQGQRDYPNLLREAIESGTDETLAESQFNRYYIRALCRRALEDGIEALVIYRAKPVATPRPESEALVETTIDPAALLEDLRAHTGEETPALGVPAGPNSGISVRLP